MIVARNFQENAPKWIYSTVEDASEPPGGLGECPSPSLYTMVVPKRYHNRLSSELKKVMKILKMLWPLQTKPLSYLAKVIEERVSEGVQPIFDVKFRAFELKNVSYFSRFLQSDRCWTKVRMLVRPKCFSCWILIGQFKFHLHWGRGSENKCHFPTFFRE